MNELITVIIDLFAAQSIISLNDLVDLTERPVKMVKKAIKLMKKEYSITTTGTKGNPLYHFHGSFDSVRSEKIKVVKEVVEKVVIPKMPGFDPCSPAKAQLRDCWHLVMASRLRGPVGVIDVEDWFNISRFEARRLMANTAKRFSDTIGKTYVNNRSDEESEYRECRLYIK